MFLRNPTHCHSETRGLGSLGLSWWLQRWKVVRLSDGWFRWRTLTAVTRYFLCPYSEYERQYFDSFPVVSPLDSWLRAVRGHRCISSCTVDKYVIS